MISPVLRSPVPGSPVGLSAGPRPRPLDAVLLYGVAVFAAILIVLASVVAKVTPGELEMVSIGLVTVLIGLVPVALDRARIPHQRHILLSVFSLAYLVYFAAPILTSYFMADPTRDGVTRLTNMAPRDAVMGQLAALLGLVSLYAGYGYPIGRAIGSVLPKPTREWPHQTALMIALVMIPLGWVVFFGSQFGLIPARAGSGALGAVATSVYFGIGLLAIIHNRYRSRPALLMMMVLIPPTIAFAFFTGSKRFALSPLIVIAMTYIIVERRVRLSWVIGGLVALIVIYPISQFYREYVQGGNTLSAIQVLRNPFSALSAISSFLSSISFLDYVEAGLTASGARLDALGITSVIVRDTPTKVPFQGGWSIGYVFLSFVPRVIWPSKPPMTIGQWVTDTYGGGDGFISSSTGSSWIGELYFNFGFTGIAIGMFIIGTYFRVLHETLFRWDATIPALLASIVVMWATCPAIEMNLIAPFTGIVFTTAPIVIAHLIVRTMMGTTIPAVYQKPEPPAGAQGRQGAPESPFLRSDPG